LGSTIAVTDASGAVLERVYYSDAFGTPTFQDAAGSPLAGTSTGTRFLFTGREWLAALNLYDYRNRTYSAELGRFMQTDPIRFKARDENLYRYVRNNAINRTDALGLFMGVPPSIAPPVAPPTFAPPVPIMPPIDPEQPDQPDNGRYWYCTTTCNVQKIDPKACCPDRVQGVGMNKSRQAAEREAWNNAHSSTPRGCYPRHCNTQCENAPGV
jgi:RHS repeat-associated protein